MNKQTYHFHGSSGHIPNVAGRSFSAGSWATIDLDTMQVIDEGFLSGPYPEDPGVERKITVSPAFSAFIPSPQPSTIIGDTPGQP